MLLLSGFDVRWLQQFVNDIGLAYSANLLVWVCDALEERWLFTLDISIVVAMSLWFELGLVWETFEMEILIQYTLNAKTTVLSQLENENLQAQEYKSFTCQTEAVCFWEAQSRNTPQTAHIPASYFWHATCAFNASVSCAHRAALILRVH